jgi:MFS family permease
VAGDLERRSPARDDPFYGWWIVAALAVTQTVSWGVLYYGFPVFLRAMELDLGRSRAELTGAFSLALVFSALAAFPVGRWIDRHGARARMAAGSTLSVLLLVGWSRVRSLEGLYLVMAGLGVAMAMVLYEAAFTVVASWFTRHRRRALTAITLVAGLASTLFMPLETELLERYGWRHALLILAALLGSVTVPLHALVLRRRPEDLGLVPEGEPFVNTGRPGEMTEQSITLEQAIRTVSFWGLGAAFVLSGAAGVALSIHLVPYLLEPEAWARAIETGRSPPWRLPP